MTTDNNKLKMHSLDGAYRFQSGKCTITLKFSAEKGAPTVEEALEKILRGRME